MTVTAVQPKLVLASASPRRRELLQQLGLPFDVVVSDADETILPDEVAADYVQRVALAKGLDVAESLGSHLPILSADTSVVIDGRILGKPADAEQARAMLAELSGREHQVYSAVALCCPRRVPLQALNITRVRFARLEPDWIRAYCASGEPLDKAGAYGVQGCAAHRIEWLQGSYSGVMGLPLFETAELLRRAGMPLPPL